MILKWMVELVCWGMLFRFIFIFYFCFYVFVIFYLLLFVIVIKVECIVGVLLCFYYFFCNMSFFREILWFGIMFFVVDFLYFLVGWCGILLMWYMDRIWVVGLLLFILGWIFVYNYYNVLCIIIWIIGFFYFKIWVCVLLVFIICFVMFLVFKGIVK